eukprot:43409_1
MSVESPIINNDIDGDTPSEDEEGCELLDIDEKIERLRNQLRDTMNEYHPDVPDTSGTIDEIKQILNEHLTRVRAAGKDWAATLNDKTLENNSLRDTIRTLKAKENDYNQSQMLEQGIDAYLQQRTEEMQQTLANATEERDAIYKQLEEEKRGHNASRELVEQYKSQSDDLTKIINEIRRTNNYNVDAINAEIAAERDRLQPMYNELKVQSARNALMCDQELSDKLHAICEAISKTAPDATKTRGLWQQDLEELREIYQQKVNQHESQWERVKDESIDSLDGEYKKLETGIDDRLQRLLKERSELKSQMANDKMSYNIENGLLIVCAIIFYFLLVSYV